MTALLHTPDSLATTQGVFTICPTPFAADGALDLASIASLVDFQIEAGVSGLAILGFLGESHKLSQEERSQVIRAFIARAGGRVPVWVGVRALGIAGAIEQAREAEALGAEAVFVAPLDTTSDAVQFDYYPAVAEAIGIPVVIHDFPDSFGTELSADLVARLGREGGVGMIKMEEPPVGQKITRILDLAEGSMRVFGGLGGVYFLEELQRGAVGTMTGFAFPEILVRIHQHHAAGDLAAAAATFDRYCPLIRYEFQPKIGLALRKAIYMRRGVIACDAIRSPGMRIDPITLRELEATVARVGLSLAHRGIYAID
ncbi:MAG: dihydrodipicolinate synthase family protein [Candidatus Dactylopiibacterium carminicum]|uniref:Dihydrodipicolinate synthase family protein n=1 Tax=Candidatus Dactylopiibacterium carminicum TaxID=857335 RepID=A0A272ERZ7_9RHOO|nr:dihydrodipicolinate synthase family protein [Candidatus Dactylopiibacterium carminicum]KAF7598913.1 dihydrodipicolinate synthase family protein [Candidatus Dactylopiibacterium carminicum]PAS92889.1 MAG: dihydrodipicolinate synthase family protein [Candidatus Dactylopiibacterium carminicum]PAS96467.1 MAG: dihydrodipicolinate synthase family protein [Candidatus Dactylopiibacterium carminicum]PAS98931.1 MAG: dihydrodipicolinate synthase family protein [Candidatus Dactylopiibacterium carminicum]